MPIHANDDFWLFCDYMRQLECAYNVPHKLTCDIWAAQMALTFLALRQYEPPDAARMWSILRATARASRVAETDPDAVKNLVHWGDRVFGLVARDERNEKDEPDDPLRGDLETLP